jgi:hypothetical protein
MGVIAACEAFRVTGGFETLQKCYQMLHTNYAAAREATEAVCELLQCSSPPGNNVSRCSAVWS